MKKWLQEWISAEKLAKRLNIREELRQTKIEQLIIVRTKMDNGLQCLILYRFGDEVFPPTSVEEMPSGQ
jgi:hypothetical protein